MESRSWAEDDPSSETWDETFARGGSLSEQGRRSAIASSLPLLGTYFSSGQQELHSSPGLARSLEYDDTSSEALIAALRLRTAISSSVRLRRVIGSAARRPSFLYATKTVDVVGAVTGQLDVNRMATEGSLMADPPSFPTLVSFKAQNTPENILVYYAGAWIIDELTQSLKAPIRGLKASPEFDAGTAAKRALRRSLENLSWNGCERQARFVRRGREESLLVGQVARRLRRREILNPSPYEQLVSWMQECLSGKPAALSGTIEWSFYGERFDSKLFELYCLYQLALEVSRILGVQTPSCDLSIRDRPIFTWTTAAGRLDLHYQRAVPSVMPDRVSRWHRPSESGRSIPLGGVPDIVATGLSKEGKLSVALVDPKLRQRSGPPTEELYKLLGYFSNYYLGPIIYGAILYHTTAVEPPASYIFNSSDGGKLVAAPLNPANRQAGHGISVVAQMITGLLR
jgi:hypothetical protein